MSAVKRRKQKLGAGDRAFNIVLGGLTAVSVVVILYPLIFVLVASISDPMEIFQGNVWLWPKGFNLEAYKQVFRNGDIFTGYKNTLIYTVVGTLVTIIITFSAAYPLSRKKLYGRSKLMGFFLFTMFFSGGMIPTYLMVKNLGLYNTMWAVILVGTVSVYNIIVAALSCRTRYRKSCMRPHPWTAAETSAYSLKWCFRFRRPSLPFWCCSTA